MGYTNFPNGLTSFGIPLPGSMPAIAGKWFFVNPSKGSDGNKGTSLQHPVKTLSKAYSLCTSGAGDGICIVSTDTGASSSTTVYESAVIDWSKCGITVWGMAAPVAFGIRARVANASASTALAYIVDVQGHNNAFYNVQFANWGTGDTALSAVKVSGNRNYFGNCYLVCHGAVTKAIRDLWLTGSNNTFVDCAFGTNTTAVSGAAACNILINGDGENTCAEDYFLRCRTYMYSSANTLAPIRSAAATSAVGTIMFQDCIFSAVPGSTEPAAVVAGTEFTTTNGIIFLCGCHSMNISDISAWTARCFVSGYATAAGAGGIGTVTT